MAHDPIMRILKIIVGLGCIIAGIIFPGGVAFFEFGPLFFSSSLADLHLKGLMFGSAYAVCAIGMIGAGFLFIKGRHSPMSKRASALLTLTISVVFLAVIGRVCYIHTHPWRIEQKMLENIQLLDEVKMKSGTTDGLVVSTNTTSQKP